ncbi:hypothetical protein PTKIN_Ptkin12aG0124600 [Pterospermum kingtungense]
MIPWGGLSCCLSAAALYLLGRSSGRDAELLRKVTRVNQLKELAQLLDIENKAPPLIVTISGRVGTETPINCEHSGLRGVIVEETDDGTAHVYVVGARGAAGFALTVGSELFEESGRSIVRGTLNYLQGLKMLGVKRIERVLPTGSSLTVVGEAVKDDTGTIRIQKPQKGPFYVTPKPIDELISHLGKWGRWYKYASFGVTIFGVFLITKQIIHYVLERRRRWELHRRILAAAAKRSGPDNEDSTWKAENGAESKRDCIMPDLCVICLEQEYNTVFIQCGHMCCCTTCSSHLTNCPLCRRRIEQVVKVFRH